MTHYPLPMAPSKVARATPVFPVDPVTGAPVGGPSGIPSVAGNLSATGNSLTFSPIAGRPFNVRVAGTFTGNYQIQRLLSGDSWQTISRDSAGNSAVYADNIPFNGTLVESEAGATYRIAFTRTTGSIDYRFSQ